MADTPTRKNRAAECLALTGKLIDGIATAEQQARLNDLLVADEEARGAFLRYINLHVALHTCYARLSGGA